MSGAGAAAWARAARPHRVARDYAVVAADDLASLTELGPAAAALFEEVATPRTVDELVEWLDLDDTVGLETMISELHEGGVLIPDGRPTAAGSPSGVRVEVGDDPRGVVLAHGLSRHAPVVIDDPFEAFELVAWATQQRVVPLLAQAVHDGAVSLPPSTVDVVVERDRAVQQSAVVLETELLAVAEVFDEAGLEFVVLKGLATGHLDHPSPAWRQTSDVDLLLSATDVGTAARLLVDRGAVPVDSDAISTIAKATSVKMPSGVEVDLHARPVMLPYGAADLLPPVPCEIGCSAFRSLDRPDRWAHAVAHYALSPVSFRRASALHDVLTAWPTKEEYPRWDDAIGRWRATTLLRVVAHDLADLGISLTDPEWLAGHTDSRPAFYERELINTRTPGPLLHWIGPLTVLGWRQRIRHLQLMTKARWQRTHPS